jgi:molybdopterin-guanine dinucleotide biosynthesis protein A
MGQSKVPLFLPAVVAAARPVFDQIIAVQRADGEAAAIETIFEAEHEEQAPAFGVLRALQHAGAECFILAVDYPLITSDLLRFVAGRFESSAAPIVAPRWNGKLQVLCAGYRHAVRDVLQGRLAAGRYDLRGLGDDAEIIEESELRSRFPGEPLLNVTTPEEWARVTELP